MSINTQRVDAKRTKPGSFETLLVPGQEVMVKNGNTMDFLAKSGNTSD